MRSRGSKTGAPGIGWSGSFSRRRFSASLSSGMSSSATGQKYSRIKPGVRHEALWDDPMSAGDAGAAMFANKIRSRGGWRLGGVLAERSDERRARRASEMLHRLRARLN